MAEATGHHIGAEGINQPGDPGGPGIASQVAGKQEHPPAGECESSQDQDIVGGPGSTKPLQGHCQESFEENEGVEDQRHAIGGKNIVARKRRNCFGQRLLHPPQVPYIYRHVSFDGLAGDVGRQAKNQRKGEDEAAQEVGQESGQRQISNPWIRGQWKRACLIVLAQYLAQRTQFVQQSSPFHDQEGDAVGKPEKNDTQDQGSRCR